MRVFNDKNSIESSGATEKRRKIMKIFHQPGTYPFHEFFCVSGWLVWVKNEIKTVAASSFSPACTSIPQYEHDISTIFCLHTVVRMIFVIVRLFCWCFPIPYVQRTRSLSCPRVSDLRDIHQHQRAARPTQYSSLLLSKPKEWSRAVVLVRKIFIFWAPFDV